MSNILNEHHPEVVDRAIQQLTTGGTLLYPTDTIYGLGCDALNNIALEKIRTIKGREADKPFIILASDTNIVKEKFDVSEIEDQLPTLWPGPNTLLLKPIEPNLKSLEGPSGKIGVRVPADSFAKNLFRDWSGLLISTSANTSQKKYSHDWNAIEALFKDKADLLIKRPSYPIHPPSNILEWSEGNWICHRGLVPKIKELR